ncbi:MAG: serine--tRNA ligase [Candidatus Omnitrophica bacterium]|nr:serine--tRNA ligase [Candidatus Omnitrophota bacterium]
MLDLKFIRENSKRVEDALKNRNVRLDVNELLKLDSQRRAFLTELENLRHDKRKESDEIAKLKTQGKPIENEVAALKTVSERESELEQKLAELERQIKDFLLLIPNVTHPSVPTGADAAANQVVRVVGEPRKFDFPVRTHLELGEYLKLIDLPRAAKISGSGFVLFTGQGARFERAMINFLLDLHTKEHGYTELSPPFLVNRASMTGTGQLPKLEADMYRLKDDDLFLIPTAEVPVTNIHANEVFEESDLPKYYTAYSACFRREAGSYGKETKGMTRVHQFDKVELVKFVQPETSYDELEKLVGNAERALQKLELPYRILALSTGDISFAAAKCYDIEVWSPGLQTWLECSSCSNFEDFQARRANIRYRQAATKRVNFVHTLNGSGLGMARIFIAMLEHHQNADGTVTLPKALRPYLDGAERLVPQF